MADLNVDIPVVEQEICVTCGFCCDGTLFTHAVLRPGERGNLPARVEEQYSQEGEREFFTLPCAYFCGKCTIYDQKRALVCGAFRCKLLKNFAKGKITQDGATQTVANVKQLKNDIFDLYAGLVGIACSWSFMELLDELPKLWQTYSADSGKNKQVSLLVLKCALLDTLLTKTFKSSQNFDALIKSSMN